MSALVALNAGVIWLRELLVEGRALLLGAVAEYRAHRVPWIVAVIAGCLVVAALLPGDVARSREWFLPQDPGLVRLCAQVGYWGELHRVPLALLGILWIAGMSRRRSDWRRAALAALLAGLVAGAGAAAVKGLTGRPRPLLTLPADGLPDRFSGPTLAHDRQSFPSGHATHSAAIAAALIVAVPPVGVAATAGAGLVAWSRMYFHRHYAGDVAAGLLLGGAVGGASGLAARRRSRQRTESMDAVPTDSNP